MAYGHRMDGVSPVREIGDPSGGGVHSPASRRRKLFLKESNSFCGDYEGNCRGHRIGPAFTGTFDADPAMARDGPSAVAQSVPHIIGGATRVRSVA